MRNTYQQTDKNNNYQAREGSNTSGVAHIEDANSHQSTMTHLQQTIGNRAVGQIIQGKADGGQENKTGLPDKLKAGVESLSGLSMNDVKVHYNSPEPAKISAHAYTKGSEIHIAPGQEQYLPHESWHVVQQKQGRVTPTIQLKKEQVNDDYSLELEADIMGDKASQEDFESEIAQNKPSLQSKQISHSKVIQPKWQKLTGSRYRWVKYLMGKAFVTWHYDSKDESYWYFPDNPEHWTVYNDSGYENRRTLKEWSRNKHKWKLPPVLEKSESTTGSMALPSSSSVEQTVLPSQPSADQPESTRQTPLATALPLDAEEEWEYDEEANLPASSLSNWNYEEAAKERKRRRLARQHLRLAQILSRLEQGQSEEERKSINKQKLAQAYQPHQDNDKAMALEPEGYVSLDERYRQVFGGQKLDSKPDNLLRAPNWLQLGDYENDSGGGLISGLTTAYDWADMTNTMVGNWGTVDTAHQAMAGGASIMGSGAATFGNVTGPAGGVFGGIGTVLGRKQATRGYRRQKKLNKILSQEDLSGIGMQTTTEKIKRKQTKKLIEGGVSTTAGVTGLTSGAIATAALAGATIAVGIGTAGIGLGIISAALGLALIGGTIYGRVKRVANLQKIAEKLAVELTTRESYGDPGIPGFLARFYKYWGSDIKKRPQDPWKMQHQLVYLMHQFKSQKALMAYILLDNYFFGDDNEAEIARKVLEGIGVKDNYQDESNAKRFGKWLVGMKGSKNRLSKLYQWQGGKNFVDPQAVDYVAGKIK